MGSDDENVTLPLRRLDGGPPPPLPGKPGSVPKLPAKPTDSGDIKPEIEKTLCVCLYDYTGEEPGDLAFKKHQVLEVITKDCATWWRCRHVHSRQKGYVPTNFIQVIHPDKHVTPLAGFGRCSVETERRQPWFHGRISRGTAEILLRQHGHRPGAFLVRESTHYPGDFTLTVCFENEFHHYRIQNITGETEQQHRLTIDNQNFFENISDLLNHYHQDDTGLCTRLRSFVRKRTTKVRVDRSEFEKGWELKPDDLMFGRPLGSGEFGDVVIGKLIKPSSEDTVVAIKTLRIEDENDRDDQVLEEFLSEAFVMTHLKHPFLLKLHGVITQTEPLCIVLDYMPRGTVLQFLRSRGRSVNNLLPQMAKQICGAMAHMESIGFVHRDLAARNVLVADDNTVRVADFGLTRQLAPGLTGTNAPDETRIPIKWTAPEVLHENLFLSKSDVWSYGITLWEIFTFGRVPYSRMTNKEVVQKLKDNFRLECPQGCSAEIYSIMKSCWRYNYKDRPSFKELDEQIEKLAQEPAVE
eukprot:Pgem_evm1s9618